METQQPAPPWGVSVDAQNVAMGDARVGQMIGHQGDVVHNTNYYEQHGDSPEDNLAAAHKLLAAGAASSALTRLEAVIPHLWTIDVAYVLTLAIVSGRAFDHLSAEDFDRLDRAFELAHHKPGDDRTAALLVVQELLGCFVAQERDGADAGRIDAALLRLRALPEDLRAELGRHMRMVLHGAVQDALDEQRRAEIRSDRLGGGRTRRVPLYFDPEPVPPVQLLPPPPQVGIGSWLMSLLGVAAAVPGLAWTAPAFRDHPVLGLCVLLLLAGGGAGVLLVGLDCYYLNRRRAAAKAEDEAHSATVESRPEPPDKFTADVRALIRQHFRLVPAPADPLGFLADTAVIRVRLERELVQLHADGDVPADRLEWLIRWHAEQAGRHWAETGGNHPFQIPIGRFALAAVSALALGAGVLIALAVRLGDDPLAGLAAAAAVATGVLLLRNVLHIYADGRRRADEVHQYQVRAAGEQAAYEAECRRLLSRPEDTEMARWLDYDKDWIKFRAMERYGLSNRDLIAHVTITEPAPGCRSARQANGPTRYSAYSVRLFLLTSNGVRQLDVLLDFVTGAENKERRNAFRYDAIASVEIEEPTVRPRGRRQVADEEGGGPAGRLPRPILRQALTLTLLNGTPIEVRNDYVSQLPDEQREDRSALESLAMDTSGAISALRTLESVAADGREWIARERARNRRQVDDYVERVGVVS
jgi:hypothetical protein